VLIVGPCGTGKSHLAQALGHIAVRRGYDTVSSTHVKLLGLLYKVEHNIKELKPEKKVERRREQAVPILEAIKAILYERIDHVPPKSLFGQAMAYTRNQWSRAVRYVECGLLTTDNNAAENAIRTVALGQKNWLFTGAPKGAGASTSLFSLLEIAKANEIDP
jgi:transposase